MTAPTWKPTTPKPTDSEAQAYVNGWYHCLDGNDVRFGNPYRDDGRLQGPSYAFYAGALDCLESGYAVTGPDDSWDSGPTGDPDPHAAGFPGEPAA